MFAHFKNGTRAFQSQPFFTKKMVEEIFIRLLLIQKNTSNRLRYENFLRLCYIPNFQFGTKMSACKEKHACGRTKKETYVEICNTDYTFPVADGRYPSRVSGAENKRKASSIVRTASG